MIVRKLSTRLLSFSLALWWSLTVIAAEKSPISMSGAVQDRAGKPVASARVFVLDAQNEWSTTTDAMGKFALEELPPNGLFLFVEHEGFRFHGEYLAKPEEPVALQITRVSEPVEHGRMGKDWTISRDERLKLIHRVFDPYLKQILASDKDNDKLRPLQFLARIDPERTLEVLEDKPFKQPLMGMAVQGKVVEQLAVQDVDVAIEVAEDFEMAYVRAISFIQINRRAKAMAKADRLALLARAAADAKSIKNPGQRIALLGLLGEALLDAGERKAGEKILRETQQAAEKVSNAAWAGYARGAFAEKLAIIDVAAALPLVTDLSDHGERIRHLGNMAHELASVHPAEAERVLNMIERSDDSRQVIHERDNYAIRVCYRMASKDLARAQKIAKSCDEKNLQALAHGLIAHAIAKDNPRQATQLLRQAYALLPNGIRDPHAVKIHSVQVGGYLLPTAERIDPTLVQEMIWRTVSLRTPRDESPQYRAWSEQQTSQLAAWLSRHDRPAARAVLDHWHSGEEMAYGRDQYTVALTLVDPQRAVKFAESQDSDGVLSGTRFSVARALAAEGEARIRIPHSEAGLWSIDTEEIDR